MPDARPRLKRALQELERSVAAIQEESTLRQRFVEAIDEFIRGSLLSRKDVRAVLDERIIRGKPDARVGGVLFEVKLPPPGPGIDAAVAQVRDQYLPEFHQRYQRPARGVAYDGLTLAFLAPDGTVVRQGRASAVAHLLESWLISLGSDIITPDDFVGRLGSASPLAVEMADALWGLFQGQRGQTRFVEEVFQVWRALYGVTTNLSDEAIRGLRHSAEGMGIRLAARRQEVEEFLFIVESYLALLLKLLVARVAVQQRLADYPSLETLLAADGSTVHGLERLEDRVPQLRGVFEEDVFLWPVWACIASPQAERHLQGVLRAVASSVDDVDLVGAPHDFLRLAYQRFIDPVSRRTLGEFYTSEELVRETLDAVGYDGNLERRLIDIACGSGTFLVEAIGRALQRNSTVAPADLLGRLTTNIVGVDIHPFAVAMARVNYLIAISPLLEASEAPSFAVPVFWADSLARLRPERAPRLETRERAPIPLTLPGLPKFRLPDPNDIEWGGLLRQVGEAVQRVSEVQRAVLNPDDVWHYFWTRADQEAYLPHENTLRDFVTTMVQMHNDNRDMRWVPLMRNILAVVQYEGSCDYVMGNPPWVRIHNISPAIRERLFDSYAMFMGAGWRRGASLGGLRRGFARQVDYAVAFVERGLEFLQPGGRLGFVITSKVMHALYGNALRKTLLREAPPIRLVDYSLHARPLFEDATNYPLVLSVERRSPEENAKTEVTVVSPAGVRRDFTPLLEHLPLLPWDAEAPWALVPRAVRDAFDTMLTGKTGSARRLLGEMQSFQPRRGVMTALDRVFTVRRIEPVAEAPQEVAVFASGYYDSRLPEGRQIAHRARIEKTMLRPLVRGADTEAWKFTTRGHILWSHDDTTCAVLECIPDRARRYFETHSRALQARTDYRRGMPLWQIFRVSPSKVGPKVLWQQLSNELGAVFVPPRIEDPVLGERLLIPLLTAYLIPVPSEIMGLGVAALLNSLPVRLYTTSFAERARGAYFRFTSPVIGLIPVPEDFLSFLENDKPTSDVTRMLEISHALHANPVRSDRPALEEELDACVARLYGLDEAALQAMREFYSFITSRDRAETPEEENVEEHA